MKQRSRISTSAEAIGRQTISRKLLVAGLLAIAAGHAGAIDLLASYQAALTNDADYLAARAALRSGAEALPLARAQLLPSLSAGYARSKVETTSPSYVTLPDQQLDYFSRNKSITLRQPIFRKALLAGYTQARYVVEESEATYEKAQQDLAIRVASAYFTALVAEESLNYVIAQKSSVSALLDSAKSAFAKGVGTRTDIDEAQARYDLVVADELAARQDIDYSRQGLETLINRRVDAISKLRAENFRLLPLSDSDLAGWQSRADDDNPDIKVLEARLAGAEALVDKARAGHYPTVDVVVQRSLSSGENVNTPLNSYRTNSAGVQVNLPIFAGGYSLSATRQAQADKDKVMEQLEATRRKVALQVRKEYQNVTEGALRIKALEQAVQSNERSVASTQKSLLAGVRSRLDVLDAEQRLVNARRDLAQARLVYLLASLRLPALANGVDQDRIAEINTLLAAD